MKTMFLLALSMLMAQGAFARVSKCKVKVKVHITKEMNGAAFNWCDDDFMEEDEFTMTRTFKYTGVSYSECEELALELVGQRKTFDFLYVSEFAYLTGDSDTVQCDGVITGIAKIKYKGKL